MAVSFTTAAANIYWATSADVKMYNSQSSDVTISAWLYSDNAGSPGSAVATFNSITVPPSNYNFNLQYTFTLDTPYKMAAGTTYWLVLPLGSPGILWVKSLTAPTGIFTYSAIRYYDAGWITWENGWYMKWALNADHEVPEVARPPLTWHSATSWSAPPAPSRRSSSRTAGTRTWCLARSPSAVSLT